MRKSTSQCWRLARSLSSYHNISSARTSHRGLQSHFWCFSFFLHFFVSQDKVRVCGLAILQCSAQIPCWLQLTLLRATNAWGSPWVAGHKCRTLLCPRGWCSRVPNRHVAGPRFFCWTWSSLHLTLPSQIMSAPCAVDPLLIILSLTRTCSAPQRTPTSRRLGPHRERHLLQRHCQHLQHHPNAMALLGACTAGAPGGSTCLSANLAARSPAVSRVRRSTSAIVGSSRFPGAVIPILALHIGAWPCARMPSSRIALHAGHPWVRPCASKLHCFRCTLFDGPASANGSGRSASLSSWLRPHRSPMGRTAAACLCPGRSHGQTAMLMISSGLAQISDTGLLRIAVVASPFGFSVTFGDAACATLWPGQDREVCMLWRSPEICGRWTATKTSNWTMGPPYAQQTHMMPRTCPPELIRSSLMCSALWASTFHVSSNHPLRADHSLQAAWRSYFGRKNCSCDVLRHAKLPNPNSVTSLLDPLSPPCFAKLFQTFLHVIPNVLEYARFHPLRPSFDLSMDPLHTTLVPRTRICPFFCVHDFATVRKVPFHRTQPCPGSATWRRVQLSKQWSLIRVDLPLAIELKFILECPDHATHLSHCSLGQSTSSVIARYRCFQGGYGSCPSCILLLLRRPALMLIIHRCVWSSASCPARPPTLPPSRLHADPLPFLSSGVQKTIPVHRSFATNIGVACRLRKRKVNAHNWR